MLAQTPEAPSVITKSEYMRRNRSRGPATGPVPRDKNMRDFYAQFVTEDTINFIHHRTELGTLRRIAEQDPIHLISTIMPTNRWHRICSGVDQPDYRRNIGEPLVPLDREVWARAFGHTAFSPSEMISVAKEAARQVLEGQQ